MLASSKLYQISRGGYGIQVIKKLKIKKNTAPMWWHVGVCEIHLKTVLEGPERE